MTSTETDDAYQAGRFIQWGLQVKVVPFNHEEYRELIDRYIDRPGFRSLVRQFCEGLGLRVLEVNYRGLFLGTEDDSVFSLKPSDFRGTSGSSAEERLLDGLVQVAIAATIYPRQQDLQEDSIEAKPPITVSEVDETLRTICSEYKRRAADDPDVDRDAIDRGLQEAWRVYESRPGVKTTQTGKLSLSSTQGLIRRHLQQLVEHGCFAVSRHGTTELYRPTLRYQIQVKELAATRLYRDLQSLLDHAVETEDEPIAAGECDA
ncbi:MAG: hypothetical protein DWQ34_13270 [Planctomycetota bacterium]|nr:MAG: hypothetical protein DWQ34_13270 [Planctomycetota bacterium]